MLAIAFAGRNAQNKMQPVCQEALEALTQRDAERWQSCLHPTKAADELRDMDALLSELGIPLRGGWQLERMTGHETEISDKDHYTYRMRLYNRRPGARYDALVGAAEITLR